MIFILNVIMVLATLSSCIYAKPDDSISSAAFTDIKSVIQECLQDVADCMARHDNIQRPFVTLAYAQSLDGKIAIVSKDALSSNFAISSPESLLLTHALRSMHDAILVGGNTLVIDNPRLNNRRWKEEDDTSMSTPCQPRPVVLDSSLQNIRRMGQTHKAKNLIVCCSQNATEHFNQHIDELQKSSITLLPCSIQEDGQLDLHDVLNQLKEKFGIQSVMVEGGAAVLTSFIQEELVDLQCVTISNKLLGSGGLAAVGCLECNKDCIDIGPLKPVTLGPDCVMFSVWKQKH
jgi:riboflavin-specific deaminase-like protein